MAFLRGKGTLLLAVLMFTANTAIAQESSSGSDSSSASVFTTLSTLSFTNSTFILSTVQSQDSSTVATSTTSDPNSPPSSTPPSDPNTGTATASQGSPVSTPSTTPTITLLPGGPAASATVATVSAQVGSASSAAAALAADPANTGLAKQTDDNLKSAKEDVEDAIAIALAGAFLTALISLAGALGTAETAAAAIVAGGTDVAALTAAMAAVESALEEVKEESEKPSSVQSDEPTSNSEESSQPASSSASSSSSSTESLPTPIITIIQVPEETSQALPQIPVPSAPAQETITNFIQINDQDIWYETVFGSMTSSGPISSPDSSTLFTISAAATTLETSTLSGISSSAAPSGSLLPCPSKDYTNHTQFKWTMPANSNTFNWKYSKGDNPEILPGTSFYFATNAKMDSWDAFFPDRVHRLATDQTWAVLDIPRNETFDSVTIVGVLNGYTDCDSFDIQVDVLGFPTSDCPGNDINPTSFPEASKASCSSSTTPMPSATPTSPPDTPKSDFHIAGLFGKSPQTQDWIITVGSQWDSCQLMADNVGQYATHTHASDEQDVPPGDLLGKSAFWMDAPCSFNTRVDFTKNGDTWTFKSDFFDGSCYSNADAPPEDCTGTGIRSDVHYQFQQYLVCTANVAGLCTLAPSN